MIVGILALQGDFAKHADAVERLGASTVFVREASQLEGIDALILPGGESTALLRLLIDDLREAIVEKIRHGLPTLATCAGTILLAREVQNPEQDSLALVDISIARNDYGRQIDSFQTDEVELTAEGQRLLALPTTQKYIPGVFIRAPRVIRSGANVQTLAKHKGDPVLLSYDKILLATFHPELLPGTSVIHAQLCRLADTR